MKRSLYAVLALPALLLGSCQSEEMMPAGGDGNVTFIAELPGNFTRADMAYGDGTTAQDLTYAVYESGTTNVLLKSGDEGAPAVAIANREAKLTLNLVKGKTYDIVFWADNAAAPYTFHPETQSIEISYDGITGNLENRDAFFQTVTGLNVTGPVTQKVMLKRPFAQINFGTDDLKEAGYVGTKVAKTTLTVKSGVYKTLNLMTGAVSDMLDQPLTFAAADLPVGQTFPVTGEYEYLSMNYLLCGGEVGNVPTVASKTLIDCTFDVIDDKNATVNTLELNNVPVQRNYRTNIFGSLLTSQYDFNIIIDENFETPDHDVPYVVSVDTPEDLVAALQNPSVQTITVAENLDLTDMTIEQLTFDTPKTINVALGKTVTLGNENRLVANNGLTLGGGGTITNVNGEPAQGATWQKSLIHVMGGDLKVKGMTLINDPDYHYHGSQAEGRPYNSAAIAYWNDANIYIDDTEIISGEFTLCGMGRTVASGEVILNNSKFTSTSTNQNGTGNWAYAMRVFGSYAELNNCEVTGIQGGVSPDGCVKMVINSGTYRTVNTPGKQDAFYAVYVTNGTELTINGGVFESPNVRTSLPIEGTSCVVSGDNDIDLEAGSIIIKGGKFSGKAYNLETNKIIDPATGFEWASLTDEGMLKWEAVSLTK